MKTLLKFNTSSCKIVSGKIVQETADSYKTFLNSRNDADFLYVYNVEQMQQGLCIVRALPRHKQSYTSHHLIFIESTGLLFGFGPTVYQKVNNLLSSPDSYFILTSNDRGLILLAEPNVATFENTTGS